MVIGLFESGLGFKSLLIGLITPTCLVVGPFLISDSLKGVGDGFTYSSALETGVTLCPFSSSLEVCR